MNTSKNPLNAYSNLLEGALGPICPHCGKHAGLADFNCSTYKGVALEHSYEWLCAECGRNFKVTVQVTAVRFFDVQPWEPVDKARHEVQYMAKYLEKLKRQLQELEAKETK